MKVACAETEEMFFLLWDQSVILFGDVSIGCPRWSGLPVECANLPRRGRGDALAGAQQQKKPLTATG